MVRKRKSLVSPTRASGKPFVAVRRSPYKAYIIAERVGLNPAVLSKLLHGALLLRPNDERVLRIAREVGVKPDEAFE